MAGVRKNSRPGGKFQGWFTDGAGKRRFFAGTRSRAETLRMAERLEDDHRQIRLGYRPTPQSATKHDRHCGGVLSGTARSRAGGRRPWIRLGICGEKKRR